MNTALVNIKDFFQKHKRNLTQPKLLNQSFQCFPQLQHDIALLRMWEHAWDHELRGRQVKKQMMSFTVIGHGLFDMNHDWELVWYSMTLWWRTWWTLSRVISLHSCRKLIFQERFSQYCCITVSYSLCKWSF